MLTYSDTSMQYQQRHSPYLEISCAVNVWLWFIFRRRRSLNQALNVNSLPLQKSWRKNKQSKYLIIENTLSNLINVDNISILNLRLCLCLAGAQLWYLKPAMNQT